MPDLAQLAEFLRRARSANLLVASHTGGATGFPAIQRLNIHEDVAGEFLRTAREAIPTDTELREYDPGYRPEPNELTYIQIEDSESVASIIAALHRIDQFQIFTEDDEFIRRLRFYAIVVGGQAGRQAVFFRHYSPKKELSRHAAFALILKRGNYSRVRERIFLFDSTVDCFSWDGALFIKNIAQFQRIFDYFEELRRKARATIQAVHRQVPIHNLADFEAACSANSLMLTKLASIARKPYLSRVTFADVERTIQEFRLEIEVVRGGGRPQLVFDSTREHRWLILKLLDDDYLGSVMTQEKYEVNSKVQAPAARPR